MLNRIYISISLLIVIINMTGCKQSLKQKIMAQYDYHKMSDSCTISINNLTSFEWDKMYVFGNYANDEIISSTVNFLYTGKPITPGFRRILFTWGRKKIYEEDYQPWSYRNSVIDFKNIDDSILNIRAYSFTQEDAFFIIVKEKIPGSCSNCFLYLLIHPGNN
jgi:hypothetical protein